MARAELGMKPREQAKPKRPLNFGLNFGDDSLLLWSDWHIHQLMPYAGGTFDQPEAWHDDMQALDYEFSQIMNRLKKGLSAQPSEKDDEDNSRRPPNIEGMFGAKP